MTKKVKLLSIRDATSHYYECMDANDWENASSYFETIKLHYKELNKKFKEYKKSKNTFTVTPCWQSHFKGIECLEDDERYAFQRDTNDYRPSNRIWIKKADTEKLYNIFRQGGI